MPRQTGHRYALASNKILSLSLGIEEESTRQPSANIDPEGAES